MTFDSHKKKILLISDLHNNIEKFNKIIQHESADINICLGDWFDSFNLDDSDDYKKTADYLMRYLSAPNNYTLFGNHDLHYLFNNHYTMCSGYEDRKYFAIDEILGSERQNITNKFKWRFWVDGILCTHAGLFPDYIDPSVKNNNDLSLFLVKEIERANIALRTDQNHWFYFAGRSRGGPKKGGGIVWLDFKQEFQPIEGLKQIVGHTYHKNCRVNPHHLDGNVNPADCDNLCIDNGLNEYIVISNGKLEIKKFLDI
jgi:hypothetical protein